MTHGVFTGALVGALVGDCIGRPYEGSGAVDRAGARRRVDAALGQAPLPYTDDTQLLLALAEHLVVDDHEVDPERFVGRILERYEGWRGYGGGMRRLVRLWRRGRDHREAVTAIFPDGSFGNGAAMRVAPVGLLWADDAEAMAAVARRSAAVTHAHPVGIDGAVVQAAAVAAAAHEGAFDIDRLAALPAATDALRAGLTSAAALPPDTPPAQAAAALGTQVTAHRSVPAALWCAAVSDDVAGAVTTALALGGDTDTIATMAGAIRGAAHGTAAAVPAEWLDAVEGLGEVRDLAARLWDAAGARSARPQGPT